MCKSVLRQMNARVAELTEQEIEQYSVSGASFKQMLGKVR